MKKILTYVPGILLSPQKTYAGLAKDPKIGQYFFWMIGVSLVLLGINQALPVQEPPPSSDVLTQKMNVFLELVNTYRFFWSALLGFLIPAITNAIAHLFSKKGSYKKLYVMGTLTALVTYVPLTILPLLELYYPHVVLSLLNAAVLFWTIVLEVLLVSTLYGISKKKAVAISILEILLIIIFFFGAMTYFVSQ